VKLAMDGGKLVMVDDRKALGLRVSIDDVNVGRDDGTVCTGGCRVHFSSSPRSDSAAACDYMFIVHILLLSS
jgi:hypothetical protein